ncbi:MAG: hypothetical protein M3317_11200 [Actinomycetota bacterium]|nr:hypothetical protein [Actinomycetota bacterium]
MLLRLEHNMLCSNPPSLRRGYHEHDDSADAGEDMSEYAGQDNETLRVTIREAALRLGVTEAAIRKRIQRGSLDKEMGEDGRVYVYLDLPQDMSYPESQVDRDPLVEELRDRVRLLERELDRRSVEAERYQHIVAGLAQANANLTDRLKELEAPVREPGASQESPGASESDVEESESAEPRSGTGGHQQSAWRPPDTAEWPVRGGSLSRPWWRRVFG